MKGFNDWLFLGMCAPVGKAVKRDATRLSVGGTTRADASSCVELPVPFAVKLFL
jgi:hypothetical protein